MLPRLRSRIPNLFLIIVPRHFERGGEVAQQLQRRKVKYVLRSEYTSEIRRPTGGLECLVVNTNGELRYFYERADLVFVGKSLTAHGGQNPIEPAALGKPVVFGPNMENFTDVIRILLAKDGAVQVRDQRQLEEALGQLLANPERREVLGRNAARTVKENEGAAQRTVDLILQQIDREKFYIVDPPKAKPGA
jgi:3-deoxy-D-manno-octulosonic-acid transferase